MPERPAGKMDPPGTDSGGGFPLEQVKTCEKKFHLRTEFSHVKENGKKFTCPVMLLSAAKPPENCNDFRFGVICSRKFHKRAVRRNRARRLVHESLRLLEKEGTFRACWIVIIPRREILNRKMGEVKEQLQYLLKKASIWNRTTFRN